MYALAHIHVFTHIGHAHIQIHIHACMYIHTIHRYGKRKKITPEITHRQMYVIAHIHVFIHKDRWRIHGHRRMYVLAHIYVFINTGERYMGTDQITHRHIYVLARIHVFINTGQEYIGTNQINNAYTHICSCPYPCIHKHRSRIHGASRFEFQDSPPASQGTFSLFYPYVLYSISITCSL